MKHLLLLTLTCLITLGSIAQGKSNKNGNGKAKTKTQKVTKVKNTKDVVYSTSQGNSKNQPAKVRAAFLREHPNATNVVWSKDRGYWTATYNNGIYRSTAVYHASGKIKDTRTPITRDQLPRTTVWDNVFNRDRVTPVGEIVQIKPSLGSELFRIATQVTGSRLQYLFYNTNGQQVQYVY